MSTMKTVGPFAEEECIAQAISLAPKQIKKVGQSLRNHPRLQGCNVTPNLYTYHEHCFFSQVSWAEALP